MGDWVPRRPAWRDVIGHGPELARARRVASRVWREAVDELSVAGMLVPADEQLLLEYAVAVAQLDELSRRLWREGWTVESERGTTRNPAAVSLGQVRSAVRAMRQDLGLGPRARVSLGRVPGVVAAEPVDDEKAVSGDEVAAEPVDEVVDEVDATVVDLAEAAGWDV